MAYKAQSQPIYPELESMRRLREGGPGSGRHKGGGGGDDEKPLTDKDRTFDLKGKHPEMVNEEETPAHVSVKDIDSVAEKAGIPEFQFISDSQDTEEIKKSYPEAKDYDSFFVSVGDGDYHAIYGVSGIVPHNTKTAYKIL